MKVYAFESADWTEAEQNGLTQSKVIATIKEAAEAARKLLPNLPKHLTIAVRPSTIGIIPEYGTGARTHDSEFIEVWFDKTVPHGVNQTLQSLHQTVLHECNHTIRWNTVPEDFSLIESAIFEGLATVFERQYTDYQPLYGMYEDDVIMQRWFTEIQDAGDDWSQREALFFDNPDGRRWIGYKTGTWIVDGALHKSGKSVIDLTTLPADEIIAIADLL